MTVFFDSSVLIAHLRDEFEATKLLLSTPIDQRLVSVLSRTEIEGGMRSGERADVAALFEFVHLVPVSDAIARRAGQHFRNYRRSHQGIDIIDYVIAASAEIQGSQLATLNLKHFPMFEGLRRPW